MNPAPSCSLLLPLAPSCSLLLLLLLLLPPLAPQQSTGPTTKRPWNVGLNRTRRMTRGYNRSSRNRPYLPLGFLRRAQLTLTNPRLQDPHAILVTSALQDEDEVHPPADSLN